MVSGRHAARHLACIEAQPARRRRNMPASRWYAPSIASSSLLDSGIRTGITGTHSSVRRCISRVTQRIVQVDGHERAIVVEREPALGHDLAMQVREQLADFVVGADMGVYRVGAAGQRLAADARSGSASRPNVSATHAS